VTERSIRFVCPECRSPIRAGEGGYSCGACERFYPVLFGIPDFRVQGDRYLSLGEERAKAARLHAFAEDHDFRELVAFYYSITDDVPAKLAPLFTDYVLNAPDRAAPALKALSRGRRGRALLDLGCGSGGALVAAEGLFQDRTGVDIALRWLVIARKRLEEEGVAARLVCADAEALPFPESSFTHVLATDLLENTKSPAAAVRAAASVLEDGGFMYVSSSNRRWIGPHPATGVWAAGLLPRRLRATLLRRRHGVDILRAVSFVSPRSVRRMAKSAGLRQLCAGPLRFDASRLRLRAALFRALARTYAALANAPLFRSVLLAAGPAFQSMFVKEEQK
jgi:ubiquinone/menaquinone biosynthesis C-methylase UbiE